MSRITAPASKLARTLAAESQRVTSAALMPKYDELLRQHTDSSRGLTTTHRPTPQPSLANRNRPLMQTFHSSAPSQSPSSNLDTTVLPKIHPVPSASEPIPRVPLLPDNYGAFHHSLSDAADLHRASRATIVAANPENVVPGAPLAPVEAVGADGVELKFAHSQPVEDRSTFLQDVLRGMADDILGSPKHQLSKAN